MAPRDGAADEGPRRIGRTRRSLALALVGIVVAVPSIVISAHRNLPFANAQGSLPAATESPATNKTAQGAAPSVVPTQGPPTRSDTVALVNGERITRQELGGRCLRRHGEDVLESLVNKQLIAVHCEQQGIKITREEIDREIARIAQRFNLDVQQWLNLLSRERGVSAAQYANDIIWPTLALRKLAAPQLTVTEEELRRAFENEYGPAVKARIIVTSTAEHAQQLLAQARANPDDFGRLAGLESEDVNSAATGGRIQPIRRHSGEKAIEEAAFRLRENEISDVIPVGNQFVILKCEGQIPAAQVDLATVRESLLERLRDKKLPDAAQQLFRALQGQAIVENILNDRVKSQAMPGIAAKVNGHPITLRELTEECISRHGREILKGMIDQKLVEQEVKRRQITITQKDLDDEVAHAAQLNGVLTPEGNPDLPRWIQMVTHQGGIDAETYLREAVWPMAALRKLVGDQLQVSEDDVQKGFAANYGPRAICRAIVLNDMRRAKQVWAMARENNTVENFAKLASEFSIEPGSQSQGGQVPPIQQFGGQPLLEKEAFQLKPGELSGIIQVGEHFIILRSEGFTEPIHVELAEVRQLIVEDILEKKARLLMAGEFDRLRAAAQIDDFIAGTSQSPLPSQLGPGGLLRGEAGSVAARPDTSPLSRR